MLNLPVVTLALVASLGPLGVPLQLESVDDLQVGTPAAGPSSDHFIHVRLSTLVDHSDLFAGHMVRLAPSRVSHILSPTLAELRDAREKGPFGFRHWDDDRLLVRLPEGVTVSRGDEVVLEGRVRTVAGARLAGDLPGAANDDLEDRGNDVLFVASVAQTVDGVNLAGRK